jgi:hypothetical protein
MEPLYTLILCLPAALVLIVCGGGVAVLWPPTAQPDEHPAVSRRQRGRANTSGAGRSGVRTLKPSEKSAYQRS